jgi:DEAD/DEAH box helicase domain-containing protein
MKKIVLDLETQKEFAEVGGRGKNHLLKISVCCIYEYETGKFSSYTESEIHRLAEILQNTDQVIGFNIKDFDFEVLRPYLNFDIHQVPYLDIIESAQSYLGHRIGLDTIAQATLGTGKSGSGREALVYWRNGRMDLLKKYCTDDVRITRDVYEFGLVNGKILYKDFFDVRDIPVAWAEPAPKQSVQKQVSLF